MTNEPLLLALDTATTCSSVAITRGNTASGNVQASLSLNSRVTHSRRLLSSIEWLMNEVSINWQDLDGIAVSIGPGSFTGLRIGMATAKGLATAADLPLYGVSTLDVLASRCPSDKQICACLDARKKELYTAFYQWEGETLQRRCQYQVLSPENLAEVVLQPTLFVGEGAHVYRQRLTELLPDACFAPAQLNGASAATLGLCAGDKFCVGDKLDLGSAVPLYVRASDAELNLGIKVN